MPTDLVATQGASTSPDVPKRLYIASDTMEPLRHMSNGQMYDSKSRFRAETRARGLTEVGNEKWPDRQIARNSPVAPEMKRLVDRVTPMSRGEFQNFMDNLGKD